MMFVILVWDKNYQKRVIMLFDEERPTLPDNYHIIRRMEVHSVINYSKEKVVEGK